MSNYYTGKTIEEATEQGLAELNLTKDEVEVLVIDMPSKGIFGFGAKPARIQIIKKAKVETKVEATETKQEQKPVEKKEKPAAKVETKKAEEVKTVKEEVTLTPIENPTDDAVNTQKFLIGLFEKLNLKVSVEIVLETAENVIFNIKAEDSSFVIGYRGEVLDSIQTLAGAVYNTNKEKYLRVVVDCENYRAKREKTLESLAKKLAQKAIKTGRKVTLEPMNPFERRVIHSALMNEEGVKTVSEGKEPNRFVAIIPDGYDASKDRRRNNNRRGGKPQGKRDFGGKKEQPKQAQKTKTFGSGVFLGNSLKDKEN